MNDQNASGCDCGCGAPTRASFVPLKPSPARPGTPRGEGKHTIVQAMVPAGSFVMGDSSGDGNPLDGETPLHTVRLDAFSIDATAVTNDQFAAFVHATGYQTEAELWGFSAVFHLAVKAEREDVMGPAGGGLPGGSVSAAPIGVIPTDVNRRWTTGLIIPWYR